MIKTIALIGLPGCGKSTYGKALAKKEHRPFYDLDAYIETKEGLSVRQIFEQKGEAYFRSVEWRAFLDLAENPEAVIATGGGLVPYAVHNGLAKPQNVLFLYLCPPLEEIVHRLSTPEALSQRPLLDKAEDLLSKMANLAEVRNKAYEAWADEVLDTF